jgi:hypothetical protein
MGWWFQFTLAHMEHYFFMDLMIAYACVERLLLIFKPPFACFLRVVSEPTHAGASGMALE